MRKFDRARFESELGELGRKIARAARVFGFASERYRRSVVCVQSACSESAP